MLSETKKDRLIRISSAFQPTGNFNLFCLTKKNLQSLTINELEYFKMPELNVILTHDYYPGGRQSGVV